MARRTTPADGRDEAVVANYFATMRHFLQTQGRVMSAWAHHGADPRLSTQGHPVSPSAPASRAGSPAPSNARSPLPSPAARPAPASRAESPVSPAVVTPQATVVVPAIVAAPHNGDAWRELLLGIVEEKTGYPRDMVGLDQNLEADLGVDSIKRVEIVGTLLQALPEAMRASLAEARTRLNTQATLAGILDIVDAATSGAAPPAAQVALPAQEAEKNETVSSVPGRAVMRPHAEPVPANAIRRITPGRFIVTADRSGVAAKLATLLRARGIDVVEIGQSVLASEELLVHRCETLRVEAPVAGLVHLAALGMPALTGDESPAAWRQALQGNEKALFLLLRELSASLLDGAHIVAASDLGGLFGREGTSDGELRLVAGCVGTLKSLRKENESLRVKAVDLDPARDASALADDLLAEIELDGGRQEVGYPQGKRTVFLSVAESVATDPAREAGLNNLVVLATGGARGITAETLRGIARAGNTLILTGRSPLEQEAPETVALADATALRDHFVAEVRAGRAKWNPREIQKRVGNVLAQREMHANIADLSASGAKVVYMAADVNDEESVRKLLHDIAQRHGPVSGVVHGAGIIEDKLLADKASDSWSRVVETKIMGLLLLQKHLDPGALKFFTVFSSVAGRYGNSGQSDYACANELMNRLCVALQAHWGDRVVVSALCWGPWGATKFGAGMVTADTEAKFAAIGVKLVSADLGRKLFREELTRVPGTPVEVVCGEAAWDSREMELGAIRTGEAPAAQRLAATPGAEPLLGAAVPQAEPTGERIVPVRLDPLRHLYLGEHMLDGKQVLPAAAALEMMAEAGRLLWPGWRVAEVREHKLMKGVELDSLPRQLRVFVQPPPYGSSEGFEVTAQLQSELAPGRMMTHYRAVLRLAQELPESVPLDKVRHAEKSLSVAKAYDEWLFHGPRFRVIEKIEGLSRAGAAARVRVSHPAQWLADSSAATPDWAFDPALLDAAAQMAWLWSRAFRDESALPARFGRVMRHRAQFPEHLHMEYERIETEDPTLIRANVAFLDDAGEPVMTIEELDSIASAALNRFGGTAQVARAQGAMA